MKLKYTHTLFTLIMVLYFVPVNAQNKKTTTKKPAAKATTKAPVKPAPKKASDAKSLGEAAAKVTAADTTKKGGGTGNTPEANGGSLAEEIIITSAYKPLLADAVKIRRNPDLEDKTLYKAPLVYAPIDKRLDQDSEIKQLNAMKMPVQADTLPYNNLVRAGVGNLKTTFVEAYFGNGKDEALQVSGWVKHLAQTGSIPNQKSNREEIGVSGRSIGPENTLSGKLAYTNSGNYFYGIPYYPKPDFIDAARQSFNTLAGEGELAKNYRDVENDFTYALKLKGYLFGDKFKARENNLVLAGFINKTINEFYTGLSASLDLSTQKDSAFSYNNSIVRLNPYLKFQGENYKIDAGVNIVNEFGFAGRFSIFPAAKLEYQIIPKYVRLFVEAKGDVNKSSLRDFYGINPFLGKNLNIVNSVDKLDLSAGLKGTLAPGLGFKATFFRNDVKNMPLMVSNFNFALGQNRFGVIYDDGTATVTGLNAELDYKLSDGLNIFGRAEYKDYKMASEAQAWNMPKFKLTAGTTINIDDRLSVTGSLVFRGVSYDKQNDALYAQTYKTAPPAGSPIIQISSFADLSGGVEYKINKQFSVFGRVNNLLNSTNQTWLYYPDYGFNIFGGASYSF
jgi:hypothetical protein